MKRLLAVLFGAGLAGCVTDTQPVTVANTHIPYVAHSRSADVTFPTDTAYASWTTSQLQKRRLELYAMVPQTQTRHGVPAYFYSGTPLPQQDEIKAIEAELNQRYKSGDKTAKLQEWWPESRRHI
jgi:hypothetical protein